MNENILRDVLAEICDEEISRFNNLPTFKTSLRHRIAMKRIFALFEKNSRKISNAPQGITDIKEPHLSLRKRLIVIFILILCAALMTGFIFGFVSKNFKGTVYTDNTLLSVINTENCPETIEYEYCLTNLPDGFILNNRDFSLYLGVITQYYNEVSEKEIVFIQWPKKVFGGHFDTERSKCEEIEINGHSGLCLEFSDSLIIFWDNGDYILEIDSNLSKDDIVFLAKSAKILKN